MLTTTVIRFGIVTLLQLGVFFITSQRLVIEDFGFFNILMSISFIVSNILVFGINSSVVYFTKESKVADWLKSIVLYHILLLFALLFFVAFFLYLFIDTLYALIAFYIFIQSFLLIINGVYQARNSIHFLNFVNLIQWSLLLIVLFLWEGNKELNLLSVVSIYLAVFTLVSICISLFHIKTIKDVVGFKITSDSRVFEFYSYGFKVSLNSIVSYLNHRVDLLIVGLVIGNEAAGYYSFATQISEKLSLFSQAFATVLFPKLIRVKTIMGKLKVLYSQSLALFILILPVFVAFYFSYQYILGFFFSDKYINSYSIITTLIIGVFIVSISRMLFIYFSSLGLVGFNSKIGFSTLVFNLVFSGALVHSFGMKGVAVATVLASTFSFTIALIYIFKDFITVTHEHRKL